MLYKKESAMNQGHHEQIMELPDLPIMYKVYENNGQLITNHWHESLEIIYVVYGHMEVYMQDKIHQLKNNDYIIINSGDIHSTICVVQSKVYLLQIPPAFLEKNIADFHTIRFENTYHDEIKNLLYQMGYLYEKKADGYTLSFQSALFQFLYILNKNCRITISPIEKNRSDKNREQLLLITNFVAKHYREIIPLKSAALVVGLQPEYFCRFFKKYMGMTFLDYVNQVRLSFIYDDLVNTDLNIYTILENRGFTNYKLFMKLFKERYGCTPSQKRKTISHKELP